MIEGNFQWNISSCNNGVMLTLFRCQSSVINREQLGKTIRKFSLLSNKGLAESGCHRTESVLLSSMWPRFESWTRSQISVVCCCFLLFPPRVFLRILRFFFFPPLKFQFVVERGLTTTPWICHY